jgi:hypothetical protein
MDTHSNRGEIIFDKNTTLIRFHFLAGKVILVGTVSFMLINKIKRYNL